MYYDRTVDETILTVLSAIASKQTEAPEATMREVIHLLNYLATLSEALVIFHALEMILNIHSDASYLSGTKARSRFAGYYFPGKKVKKTNQSR